MCNIYIYIYLLTHTSTHTHTPTNTHIIYWMEVHMDSVRAES